MELGVRGVSLIAWVEDTEVGRETAQGVFLSRGANLRNPDYLWKASSWRIQEAPQVQFPGERRGAASFQEIRNGRFPGNLIQDFLSVDLVAAVLGVTTQFWNLENRVK